MKRYLYVLLLIMSALIVDVCAQTSPTYDDKTPPAFEWGKGKMNAQKQGTPTTGDREIIANINVTVDNVAERLISKTTDKSITDVAEDILEAVNSNNTDLTELAVLLKDASGTTSIFDKVNNIDGRLIYTPEGATESVDITELLAQTKKAIEEKAEIIDGRLMYTPAGATESVDITELVAKLDVTLNTAATQIIASMPSMSTVDSQINYLASEAEKLQVATLTSIIGNINSNAEGLRWTEFRHANSVKAEDDVTTDTVVSLLREIKNKEAGEVSSITTDIDLSMIKAEDDVATDTVVSLLREIKNKEAGGDVELSDTNNLISSNTEKLSATTTHTVPNYIDDTLNTSTVKSLAQMIAEQLGSTVNNSYYETDGEGNPYETYPYPTVCRLVSDIAEMINNVIVDNYDWYFNYPTYDSEGNFSGYPSLLGVGRETLEDGSDKEFYVGAAQALMSPVPVEITATYSRTLTVADGLFTDKNGNPTHVLGRILQAVENGGSGSSGSSGSVDLQKIERGVGVVLNEGSEGGKDEPPEMEINLVDCFYDKGTGIGDFCFRGDDFAYLDEGISMYDMTKAGLFGYDVYGNVTPLLREMLQVSFSADSRRPKMADVVYGIGSKIPQGAIASISQETLSSRIHLGNIYTKLGALDNRVATLTNELITLPSKRMGITANIAIGTNAVEFGSSAYPSKTWQGCHRQFIEIISDEGDDGEFMIAFDSDGDTRKVKGRILLNIDKSQHVWISADSSSTVTVTEGWR